ncbi:MAG: hypothetical protein MUF50_03735 [Planctomycetes bacterium]|jgi:hypothetical protein|nr:hypothetical protein [Planctomycetota bacterium]
MEKIVDKKKVIDQTIFLGVNPKHWLDIFLWPLLKIFLEPFSNRIAHSWHWTKVSQKDYESQIGLSLNVNQLERVPGFKKSKPLKNYWNEVWHRNFIWQRVAILAPENGDHYHLAYMEDKEEAKINICKLIFKERIGILLGPDDAWYFGIKPDTKEIIKLDLLEKTTKNKVKVNKSLLLI